MDSNLLFENQSQSEWNFRRNFLDKRKKKRAVRFADRPCPFQIISKVTEHPMGQDCSCTV